jgi:hypothetical protein
MGLLRRPYGLLAMTNHHPPQGMIKISVTFLRVSAPLRLRVKPLSEAKHAFVNVKITEYFANKTDLTSFDF